jgi:hypothetical protein
MEIINRQRVMICGDNHGKYDQLFQNLDNFNIRDCIIIHVGDGGEGFLEKDKQLRQFNLLNDRFKKRNIEYMSIRGNHSDPKYFDGSIKLSNFRLLPDYHVEFINDEKFLFVGGAVSIDRKIRKPNFSYWEDELFVLKPEFAVPCDVLITHSAPFWLGEFTKNGILGWCEKDEYLWRDCVKERDELATLFELAKPKKAYVGHFHTSLTQKHNGCIAKILNELEIIEHR